MEQMRAWIKGCGCITQFFITKRGQPYITVIKVIDGRGFLQAVMSERLSTCQVTGMSWLRFLDF
jgi:hypothetical protein